MKININLYLNNSINIIRENILEEAIAPFSAYLDIMSQKRIKDINDHYIHIQSEKYDTISVALSISDFTYNLIKSNIIITIYNMKSDFDEEALNKLLLEDNIFTNNLIQEINNFIDSVNKKLDELMPKNIEFTFSKNCYFGNLKYMTNIEYISFKIYNNFSIDDLLKSHIFIE